MTQKLTVESLFWQRLRAKWLSGLIILLMILRNGGIFIAFFGLLYAYGAAFKKLLAILPPGLPSAWLIGGIVALYLTRARIRTLLKEPDLVFLLPAEQAMARYFRASFWYSACIQVVHLFLLLAVLLPLFYFKIGQMNFFLFAFAILAVVKIWNVHRFRVELRDSRRLVVLPLLRLGINLLIAVSLLDRAWWYACCGLLLAALWSLVQRNSAIKSSSWPQLIEAEQKTLASYLSIANFFIDIPSVKNRIVPRKWLTYWLAKLPVDRQDPFFFLFARMFVRSSEYFGIFVRLTLLLLVILCFVHAYIGVLATIVIGLYITGLQLPNIGENRRYPVIMKLYPMPDEQQVKSFTRLAVVLLFTQCVVLCLPVVFASLPWLTKLILVLISFLVTYLICFQRLPKKFAKLLLAPSGETEKQAD